MLKLHVGSVNQEHGWIAGAGMAEEEGKASVPTLANVRTVILCCTVSEIFGVSKPLESSAATHS